MTLVGRDDEIAILDAIFQDCVKGCLNVAVIRGPVASGKTALLTTFADRMISRGELRLGAVASNAERELPFSILDQLFRGTGELAGLMAIRASIGLRETATPQLAEIFEKVLDLIADLSRSRSVVITVDDIHHADAISLQFISYLARRGSELRVLVVLTDCTQAILADHVLHAEILRQGNCRTISLRSFPLAGVVSLLNARLGVADARRLAPECYAMTGGNPLLVNALAEDIRGAAGDLAQVTAFRDAVVTCLHRYDPALVELAQVVAILGESATCGLVADVLGTDLEYAYLATEALAASGLLASGQFRHEAARQAVLTRMSADELAAMHGRVARALHRAGAASPALAEHLVATHPLGTDWAVPALRDAAEYALADGNVDRAIAYLRRAVAHSADERQQVDLRFALACTEWEIDPELAAHHFAELAVDARAGLIAGERLSELAYYLLWAGDVDNAADVLGAADSPSARSPLNLLYPDLARRTTHHRACHTAASALDKTVKTASAARAAEWALQERSRNNPTLASITSALITLICDDELDQAAFWCGILLRESEATRAGLARRAILSGFLAMIETRRGNLPAAESHARTSLTSLTDRAWGVAIGGPLSSLLLAATASNRHEAAVEYLRTPVPEAMFGTVYGLLFQHARGEYYLATGRPRAALADFESCGDRMTAWGLDLPGLVPWRTKAAEAHLMLGDARRARELSRKQLEQLGSQPSRTRGISLRVLARASHLSKRTALLRESAEMLRDTGARLELAYTFSELSNAHQELGEYARAHWAARQARNLAEKCGARALNETIKVADLDGHETADDTAAGPWAQLSNAERRVAALAAYGYTNGQISAKLFITVSTVEQHLTRVYRKLGVAGRAELPIEI